MVAQAYDFSPRCDSSRPTVLTLALQHASAFLLVFHVGRHFYWSHGRKSHERCHDFLCHRFLPFLFYIGKTPGNPGVMDRLRCAPGSSLTRPNIYGPQTRIPSHLTHHSSPFPLPLPFLFGSFYRNRSIGSSRWQGFFLIFFRQFGRNKRTAYAYRRLYRNLV